MKQSVVKAKEIVAQIKGLEDQLKELENALDELEDQKETLPYRLIHQAYEDKERELRTAYNQSFMPYQQMGI
ncbi:hypothetical protein [Cytobacillus horneckiae]|uniref:hypothetical protein n=1 Tax=Cytobacillus horneckiae TaxID=549687 RepID=UPI003D9A6764